MTRPPCVILAGGKARRMGGGDKGLLELAGQTLIERVIARLTPQCGAIAINANGDPARFAHLGLPVLPDSVPGHLGPLAGVLAGLDWAAECGAQTIVTAAADTPFLPGDLAARLLTAAEAGAHPLALAATEEEGRVVRHPTFGLWPTALREDLRNSLQDGTRKVVEWADRHRAAIALFGGSDAPFFNVNTPEDLATARDRARRLAP
ncbi:MAG: molybdenum cofactor guanylyltransferase MobA [Pseudomonadota bacterium]